MNQIIAEAQDRINALTDAEYSAAVDKAKKDLVAFIESKPAEAAKDVDSLFECVGEFLRTEQGALLFFLLSNDLEVA